MAHEYGDGQKQGDWTADTVPHGTEHVCTECGDKIAPDVWFFQKGPRLLCAECVVLVLNAREDFITELQEGQ